MAIRPNVFNPFILGRRLFQQWVVDSYVKIEKYLIQYCKDNQEQLRADTYKGLQDYLHNAAEVNGSVVMKNMIHGPCADWCMVDNKCSKHFPKEFKEETKMDENGYPDYQRKNDGKVYERMK
uniref:Helitron helicase-like domain-containing protein n=1 Tax=Trichogramma kaykai TaxID=54128 RepID=A0ABD2X133_9HYME